MIKIILYPVAFTLMHLLKLFYFVAAVIFYAAQIQWYYPTAVNQYLITYSEFNEITSNFLLKMSQEKGSIIFTFDLQLKKFEFANIIIGQY